jgi:hypothetical protein
LNSLIQKPHQPKKKHGRDGGQHTQHSGALACNKIKVGKKMKKKSWGREGGGEIY